MREYIQLVLSLVEYSGNGDNGRGEHGSGESIEVSHISTKGRREGAGDKEVCMNREVVE